MCQRDTCAQDCDDDGDCPPGEGCGTGFLAGCQPTLPLGALCDSTTLNGPNFTKPCDPGLVCVFNCLEPCAGEGAVCSDPEQTCQFFTSDNNSGFVCD